MSAAPSSADGKKGPVRRASGAGFALFVLLAFSLAGLASPANALLGAEDDVNAVLDPVEQDLEDSGTLPLLEPVVDPQPVTVCVATDAGPSCALDPTGPDHGACAGDHGGQMYVPGTTSMLTVFGTLTFHRPLGSSSWSSACAAPPTTAEMHTYAESCPPLLTGITSTAPSVADGVYCGHMLPPFGYAVCHATRGPINQIRDLGLAIGFDRGYLESWNNGVLTHTPKNYDGVIRSAEGEGLQDAGLSGTGVLEHGVRINNPYGEHVRIIAYPTSLDGARVSGLDMTDIGCTTHPYFDVCLNAWANHPIPSQCIHGGANGTGPIPTPPDYHGELRYTPFSGGLPKQVCFCGDDGTSAGRGGTVNVVNGEFVIRFTPLQIAAERGADWAFNVTYRTLSPDATHTNAAGVADLGYHWDYGYGRRFEALPNGDLKFHDGDGLSRTYGFAGLVGTTKTYETPLGYYDRVEQDTLSGTITRRGAHGDEESYQNGRLVELEDRNGNRIQFTYDTGGRLQSSIDAHNRLVNFLYDAGGRIQEIADFAGRSVHFHYCGQLLCRIQGLGDTNVTFTYQGNGAMVKVLDAKNETYLQNRYDNQFRVDRQRHGDPHQVYRFLYRETDQVTTVFDRNGNRVDHHYVSQEVPLPTDKVVFSNRGIDRTDEPTYTTTYEHNRHFERTGVTYPNGNFEQWVFDEDRPLRQSQGNLLRHTRDPGPMCGTAELGLLADLLVQTGILDPDLGPNQCTTRTTTYTYETTYNQVLTHTDARENDPDYVPPNGGPNSASRYTTTYTYDTNGDLKTATRPFVHPFGAPEGFDPTSYPQTAIDQYTYNSHGQLVEHIDPSGVRETFQYFPASGGSLNPNDREGYLANHTRDADGLRLQTNYTYSIVGEVQTITDPAGNTVRLKYDDRCLVSDFEGPPLLGNQDRLLPQARRVGEDNVTVDAWGVAIVNKTRLAYAVSGSEAQRLARLSEWASLPQTFPWFLLNSTQATAYVSDIRIYENVTGEFFRDGIDGDHLPNGTFRMPAPGGYVWLSGGTFHDLGLTAFQRRFLQEERSALAHAAAFVGGEAVEPVPLEQRNLTKAAEWAQGKAGVTTTVKRDANGLPAQVVRQSDTQEAAPGAQRQLPGPKVDENKYDVLGNLVEEVTQTAPQLPDVEESNLTVTRYFYDYNENLVCKHTPLRVQQGHMHNIETWVYNERDLKFSYARGDPTVPINVNGRANCADPYCPPDERLYGLPLNYKLPLPPLPHCCPPNVGAWNAYGTWQDPAWQPCPPLPDWATQEQWNYDGNGNLERHVDARGNERFVANNGFDEAIVEFDALGNRVERYHDPLGNVVQEKWYEPGSAFGLLATLLDELENATGQEIPPVHAISNSTLLSWTRHSFDERNREYATGRAMFEGTPLPVALVDSIPFAWDSTERDAMDRTVRTINANGHATDTRYDAVGRTVWTEDAEGNFVEKRYDNASNVVWEHRHDESTRSGVAPFDLVIERDYDAMGRLVNETDNHGRRVHHAYDARSQETAAEDATGKISKHVDDGAGRRIVDYHRLGERSITTRWVNSTFYIQGHLHTLNGTVAGNGTFEVEYRTCVDDACRPIQSCLPYTNFTCRTMFEQPCADLDLYPMMEILYWQGCCAFVEDGTLCMDFDNSTGGLRIVADDVWGVFTLPDDAEYECYATTWPNFACTYNGTMAPIMVPSICKETLPVECRSGNTLVTGCINDPICPPLPSLGSFPNGTVVRVYPGPYWDQHAVNGTWDGYSYYYGITLRQEWDINSRLVARIDGEGNPTAYGYDDLNRQVVEMYADGTFTTMTLDENDNVVEVHDPNGNVVTNAYDELDRLADVFVQRPFGAAGTDHQAFTYDGLGRQLTSLDEDTTTPGSAVEVSWTYDSRSNVVSETTQGYTVTSTYDPVGNRLTVQYPNGRLVNHTYDDLDRLSRIDDLVPSARGLPLYDEQPIAEYAYLGSRLVHRLYGNGVERTIEYVEPGSNSTMPKRIEDRNDDGDLLVGFQYKYDDAGHKQSVRRLHAPHASALYDLDAVDRLVGFGRGALDASGSSLVAPGPGLRGQTWTLTDGNDWQSTAVQTGNSVETRTREHNERHELVQESIGGVNTTYAYDGNGNLIGDGTLTYRWDFKNRLVDIRKAGTGELVRAYRYDADNRRVNETTPDGTTHFVLDGRQEIEDRDRAGGLLKQYVYGPNVDEVVLADTFEPLCPPESPGGCVDGQCIIQPGMLRACTGNGCFNVNSMLAQESGCITLDPLCIFLSQNVVCAPPETDSLLENVTGLLERLASIASLPADRHWYHLDDQHSTVLVTNETGVPLEGYEYTPYGTPIVHAAAGGVVDWVGDVGTTSQIGNRILYTGRSWDGETGLHYYRTRYYDPDMGRFISSDTIGIWKDPLAFGNGYTMTGNQPRSYRDPSGHGWGLCWKFWDCDNKKDVKPLEWEFNFFTNQKRHGKVFFDIFIPNKSFDDRGPQYGSNLRDSRVAIVIDYTKGSGMIRINPTCALRDCNNPLGWGDGNHFAVSWANEKLRLMGQFQNSRNPINFAINVDITIDASGDYLCISGKHDGFPAYEIHQESEEGWSREIYTYFEKAFPGELAGSGDVSVEVPCE